MKALTVDAMSNEPQAFAKVAGEGAEADQCCTRGVSQRVLNGRTKTLGGGSRRLKALETLPRLAGVWSPIILAGIVQKFWRVVDEAPEGWGAAAQSATGPCSPGERCFQDFRIPPPSLR